MPSTAELVAFSLTSMILIAIPGPSVLFVISRSLSRGRRAGLATVIGNSVGEYVLVIAVAVGIGPLVEDSIVAFTAIKLVGAGYLVYLGIQALRHRRSIATALNAGQAHTSTRRILRDGFIVGVTNPKSMIYFAALLPQFVNRSAGHVPLQLLLLGWHSHCHRSGLGYRVGVGGRCDSLVACPIATAAGVDWGRQWPCHDRYRRKVGRDRSAQLTVCVRDCLARAGRGLVRKASGDPCDDIGGRLGTRVVDDTRIDPVRDLLSYPA